MHLFLFFIDKVPGITIKNLLKSLEISKQGSHATLRKLKEEGLIVEKQAVDDKRVKQLYVTEQGQQQSIIALWKKVIVSLIL